VLLKLLGYALPIVHNLSGQVEATDSGELVYLFPHLANSSEDDLIHGNEFLLPTIIIF
jgi:hypothetical protein